MFSLQLVFLFLFFFFLKNRKASPNPEAGAVGSRGGPRAQALHTYQPSQHYSQVPFQQPRIPTSLSGSHHPPPGPEVLQEAGSARSFTARWDQPEGPKLSGEHFAAGTASMLSISQNFLDTPHKF